jgi:diguanylate cyclase (GGDEF)-like protein/PAS domain S-box-containing protein
MTNSQGDTKTPHKIKNVLAVDNDAIMLKFLSRILEKAGLHVVTAVDGVTAIDILESYTPDLFFIDLVMPNIDGRSLCRIIRSQEAFKTTPIVIISAIAAEESIDTVSLGANVCIAKVAYADMETIITRFLDDTSLLWEPSLGNRVLGADALAPRNITNELLTINRHYRIMLDSISNGIIELDQNNRIIYANPAALSFFSMTAETMLGKNISQLFPLTSEDPLYSMIHPPDTAEKSHQQSFQMTIQESILNISVVASGASRETQVIVMEDITQRENSKQKLIEANEKLEVLARVDGLTSVSNRRHFDDLLPQEWGRMRREKGELALLICDVDYFKLYNDTYGHLEGDSCLRLVAQSIDNSLQRPSDIVARYGGDEFVVLLPNTNLDGALHLAAEIHAQVDQLKIKHQQSPISDWVTVTIGACSGFPDESLPEYKFIWLADKALYEAKLKGRNRAEGKAWPSSGMVA